jgi:nucleoside-diphosphate-sugar epimerase
MARIGIIGGRGFIGSAVVAHALRAGHDVFLPQSRDEAPLVAEMRAHQFDALIYCAGLTADFRSRPFDTVQAHVSLLSQVLQTCQFESLCYLSSTRVYVHCTEAREDAPITVNPLVPEDLFGLTKLTGESLCFNSGRTCRVVRVSNVFGPGDPSNNFIPAVLREAVATGRVTFQLSQASAKDYISLRETAEKLLAIALSGRHSLYNLASGRNTPNSAIAEGLSAAGIPVAFAPGGRTVSFPAIVVDRLADEFGRPTDLVADALPALLEEFRAAAR